MLYLFFSVSYYSPLDGDDDELKFT